MGNKSMNPYSESSTVVVVQRTLMDVLECKLEEVGANVSIGDDLDADSFDYLEIKAYLERQLGIELPQKSVLDHLGEALGGNEQIYSDGLLTEIAAFVLQQSCFKFTVNQVKAGMRPADALFAITVKNLANLCHSILSSLPQRCPKCGHHKAVISSTHKPACAACNKMLRIMTGDSVIAASLPEILKTWNDNLEPANSSERNT